MTSTVRRRLAIAVAAAATTVVAACTSPVAPGAPRALGTAPTDPVMDGGHMGSVGYTATSDSSQ